jgi:hypothetical protein
LARERMLRIVRKRLHPVAQLRRMNLQSEGGQSVGDNQFSVGQTGIDPRKRRCFAFAVNPPTVERSRQDRIDSLLR